MAKTAAWNNGMEELMLSINKVLTSLGLMDKDTTIFPSMTGQTERILLARDALEEELIVSGGHGVLMTDARITLLKLTPVALLKKMKDGSLTAVATLQAYQAKAIEETKRTNCVTEFIPNAKKWAESLDAIKRSKFSDVELPLHGLPLSVKDNVSVEGLDATLGLRKKVGHPIQNDAVIVQLLKKLGAVPFVKTNVSQLCLSVGCSNPVWGATVNPHNSKRTPGGSSGGEGCLVASGGSVLGVGTDIGGSIRIPANFCGVVGFKPTARRLCNKGVVSSLPGAVGVFGTAGLIGRDTSIVIAAIKSLLSIDISEYDSNVPPVPWREALFSGNNKKCLRIGWYDQDGLFPSTPGVRRAVAETVVGLKMQGHEMVQFVPPDVPEAIKMVVDFIMADQGNTAYNYWKGDTIDPSLTWYKTSSQIPSNLKALAKPLMRHQYGEIAADLSIGTVSSAYDLWRRLVERAGYVDTFTKAWKKEELDVLICPCFPMPAPTKDTIAKITVCASYCMLYNLLDYPAVCLPITRETDADQAKLTEYKANDFLHTLMKEDCKGASGLPIGIQVVALPFCEEILCRAMQHVAKTTKFSL